MSGQTITLTVAEIKDLAESVGFVLKDGVSFTSVELETEIVITECPEEGVLDDDNQHKHYAHIAYFEDCPEEGCYPLGAEAIKWVTTHSSTLCLDGFSEKNLSTC